MSWQREFCGIPFRAFGRDREGCDCWGLLRLIFHERAGIDLPSFEGYESVTDGNALEPYIAERMTDWIEVVPGEELELDALLLAFEGTAMHVGVVTRPGWMIHVMKGCSRSIEERYRVSRWRDRIVGIYRHKALA